MLLFFYFWNDENNKNIIKRKMIKIIMQNCLKVINILSVL